MQSWCAAVREVNNGKLSVSGPPQTKTKPRIGAKHAHLVIVGATAAVTARADHWTEIENVSQQWVGLGGTSPYTEADISMQNTQ